MRTSALDLAYWTFVPRDEPGGRHTFVMVRGHVHPGETAGQYAPGVTAEADDELRKITRGDDLQVDRNQDPG